MPSARPPIYQGYTGWPDGLSVWPSERRKFRWEELEWIHTRFMPDNRSVVTTFGFRSGRKVTLRAARDFSWTNGRGRFAEVVALAVAAAPKETKINEDTLELAMWGSRASRRAALRPAALRPGADTLVERARHHRVWMELPKSLSLVKQALQQQPDHAGALRLRCVLYWQIGRRKEARRAAQEWVAARPDDPEAKTVLLQIELAFDNTGIVDNALAALARTPADIALVDALSGFHFRRGEYEKATAVWERFAPHAPDPEAREFAAERARYVQRYGTDPRYRRGEQLRAARRTALFVAIALGPLVLFAGFQVWNWNERRERNKRLEEIRKDLDERMQKTDREITEATGRVFGTPEQIRERAETGEPAAQFTYGEMLIKGDKVAKDVPSGLSYLERAAEAGSMEAARKLAGMFLEGELVEKDPARAAEFFRRAADLGSPYAALSLGGMLLDGDGIPVDKAAAFAMFERSAAGGSIRGMKRAGWALEHGEGVERDVARALGYYRSAAEKDDRWAIERLIMWLVQVDGPHRDSDESWKWITAGARLGSERCRVTFAAAVLLGGKEDDAQAASALPWLIESAEKGEPIAQAMLGSCYLNGWGVPQDFAKAVEWLGRSEPSNDRSRATLSLCHAFGLGVPRDIGKARELRSKVVDPDEQKWLDRFLAAAEMPVVPARSVSVVFREEPKYPARMLKERIEGSAMVRFAVDRDGFVRDARVVESTRSEFEAPALVAISCWRFVPLEERDSVTVQQQINFTLQKE